MGFLSNKGVGGTDGSADVNFLVRLDQALGTDFNAHAAPVGTMRRAIVGESINEQGRHEIENYGNALGSALANVLGSDASILGDNGAKLSQVQVRETIAVTAGQMVSVFPDMLNRSTRVEEFASENVFPVSAEHVPEYMGKRSSQLLQRVKVGEAFDNRETRAAVLYTMAFNYNGSRQNDFGETIWPTLSLPADQVGYGIVVNRLTVHRGWLHSQSGDPVRSGKIDLMRAAADHEILQKKKTKVVPVHRSDSAKYFVDNSVMTPQDVNHEGVLIKTAALKVGETINLLGISQTDASLAAGTRSTVDTLDPAISLETVLVKIGNDVFEFNVYGYQGANFTYAPQGVDKRRILDFDNRILSIRPTTKRRDGTDITNAALIAALDEGYTVKLRLKMTGEANTEFGDVEVFGNRCAIAEVRDENGDLVPGTDSFVQDLQTAFATAAIVGWTPAAWLTNMSMRDNGDVIDRTSFTQLYEVPLLSPVTARRPVSTSGQMDASDYESLLVTVRFRLRNDSVTAIFDACSRLNDLANNTFTPEDLPSIFGAARFHVLPRYIQRTGADAIKVTDLVGSVDNRTVLQNLNAAITNFVRDTGITLYIDSEYEAAQDALGITQRPTLIIATDPRIHRYLLIDGDVRTGTEVFDVKIVSTIDRRFKDKLFMTFGVFDQNRNSAPNILNWGNLIWGSEVVHSAQIPREGGMSIETIVQPRYLFANHLPIAALIEFQGIPDVFTSRPILAIDNKNTIEVNVPPAPPSGP